MAEVRPRTEVSDGVHDSLICKPLSQIDRDYCVCPARELCRDGVTRDKRIGRNLPTTSADLINRAEQPSSIAPSRIKHSATHSNANEIAMPMPSPAFTRPQITPTAAMMAGLAGHVWSFDELFAEVLK